MVTKYIFFSYDAERKHLWQTITKCILYMQKFLKFVLKSYESVHHRISRKTNTRFQIFTKNLTNEICWWRTKKSMNSTDLIGQNLHQFGFWDWCIWNLITLWAILHWFFFFSFMKKERDSMAKRPAAGGKIRWPKLTKICHFALLHRPMI